VGSRGREKRQGSKSPKPLAGARLPTSNVVPTTLGKRSPACACPDMTGAHCRMDLPGPTTSVGTRTDYSVGPWDYPPCATRHLKAWSTRTTQE
jgi:hypothetical protein